MDLEIRPRRSALQLLRAATVALFLSACVHAVDEEPPADEPPPPPPPAATNGSLTNLTVDETFDAASVILSFDVDGAGATSNVTAAQAGVSAANTVAYDAADNLIFPATTMG